MPPCVKSSLDFSSNDRSNLKRRHDSRMSTRRGVEKPCPLPAQPGSRTEPEPQRQRLVVRNPNQREQRTFHRPLHHHPRERARQVRAAVWLTVGARDLKLFKSHFEVFPHVPDRLADFRSVLMFVSAAVHSAAQLNL